MNKRSFRRYNPFYFIYEALRSFWRNRVMGFASILVLTSCLILLGAFGILIHNININLENLGTLNEIVVFLEYDLSQEEVDTIASDLQQLENVTYVEYISKSQGFEEMKLSYPEYAELFEEMSKRGDNPLADSFIISYQNTEGVNDLEYSIQLIPGVRTVNNRLDYAVTIENFKNGVSFVFIWFFILLFAVSIFVIFNTIKLAVHGRQTEISIMRYIGATKCFIITPFVIEGLMIGLISGLVAFFTDAGIYKYLLTHSADSLQMLELAPAGSVNIIMLLGFLAIGTLTGIFASVISLHKNLSH